MHFPFSGCFLFNNFCFFHCLFINFYGFSYVNDDANEEAGQ